MIPHMKLKNQQSEVFKVMTGVTLEGEGRWVGGWCLEGNTEGARLLKHK